jgi:hypothetical protein
MADKERTKEAIRGQARQAADAIFRACDGLDSAGEMLHVDVYVFQQIEHATEALRQAKMRLVQYQAAFVAAEENKFSEG